MICALIRKLELGFAVGGQEIDRLAGERERERQRAFFCIFFSPLDPLRVFYFLIGRIFNGLTCLTCNQNLF